MTLLPLQVISYEQGVPIPDSNFSFKIPKVSVELFKVGPVEVKDVLSIQNAFLLGISTMDSLSLGLATSPEEIVDSIAFIGTLCELVKVAYLDNDEYGVACKIHYRVNLNSIDATKDTFYCNLSLIEDRLLPGEAELLTDMRSLIRLLLINENILPEETIKRIATSPDVLRVSNILAASLNLSNKDQLRYLQAEDTLDKFTLVLRNLIRAIDKPADHLLVTDEQISQLIDPFHAELKKTSRRGPKKRKSRSGNPPLEKKLQLIKDAPQEVLEKINREVQRLSSLPPGSLEYQALHEYLTWVADIPWGITTHRPVELSTLIETLDATHYGLEEVKEHILEYLTIEHITKSSKGTVLCFAGPPGTGKTSIAKQIASACNRQLIRIALGGLSDEAELRGHRRTYVASRPGRIITGIKQAQAMDPLFLLDEVDKLDTKRGDPTAALLEILDPEQNNLFMDRYLELPVDLSRTMFICTANYLEDIPEPLLDRFEIVDFREYTVEEREIILKKFMVKKWTEEYGLSDLEINFEEGAYEVLSKPTGIRDIERNLKKLLRKAAVQIVVKKEEKVTVTSSDAKEIAKRQSKKPIGFSTK